MSLLRKMLVLKGGGGGAKLIVPSANSYFNLIGTVDLREQGGYYDRGEGGVALYTTTPMTPGANEGAYFNRQ